MSFEFVGKVNIATTEAIAAFDVCSLWIRNHRPVPVPEGRTTLLVSSVTVPQTETSSSGFSLTSRGRWSFNGTSLPYGHLDRVHVTAISFAHTHKAVRDRLLRSAFAFWEFGELVLSF